MLGWKPYEYYTSSPYEFFAACEGYFIKMEHESRMLRTGFYRVHQSLVPKPLKINEFWPLFGDEITVTNQIVWTPEMLEQIKATHGIN